MTPETMARRADPNDFMIGRASRTAINRIARREDESHMWPINGRFSATDRAIREASKYMRESGDDLAGLEYAYFLDGAISRIVNGIV